MDIFVVIIGVMIAGGLLVGLGALVLLELLKRTRTKELDKLTKESEDLGLPF